MVSLLTTGITCTTRISSSSHRFTPTALHLLLLLQWIYCSNQITFRQFKDDPDAIQASQGRLALVESGALFRASSELGQKWGRLKRGTDRWHTMRKLDKIKLDSQPLYIAVTLHCDIRWNQNNTPTFCLQSSHTGAHFWHVYTQVYHETRNHKAS